CVLFLEHSRTQDGPERLSRAVAGLDQVGRDREARRDEDDQPLPGRLQTPAGGRAGRDGNMTDEKAIAAAWAEYEKVKAAALEAYKEATWAAHKKAALVGKKPSP